jgi:ribonuclease HI
MTKKIDSADVKNYLAEAPVPELLEFQKLIEQAVAARKERASRVSKVITFTDGASRGNPGHAGIGVLIFNEAGEKILQDFRYIGTTTNNEAEYRALLLALDRAYEITQDTVECYMDSELVCRQITGRYAVKSEKMAGFLQEVRQRIPRFRQVSFHNVPREHPRLQLADKLANRAIDEAKKT